MEKKFYTDDFEQLLKEKSDQFRMYPSKRVWHSIYNDLHPGRKWPSVAMSMLLILALLFIGYLNTGDNTVIRHFADNTGDQNNISSSASGNTKGHTKIKDQSFSYNKDQPLRGSGTENSSTPDMANTTETAGNSFEKNIDPNTIAGTSSIINNHSDKKYPSGKELSENNSSDFLQTVDSYIKTNQIFADIAAMNKKKKIIKAPTKSSANNTGQDINQEELSGENTVDLKKAGKESSGVNIPVAGLSNSPEPGKLSTVNVAENLVAKDGLTPVNKSLSAEEKAWIENYAMHNKSRHSKWKGRTAIELYATPSLNYRQLNTDTKGSATPYANTNINSSVSQKPGLGLEAGVGLAYAFAKNIRIKAGIQFNFTNYGINADQTNHPVLTSLLLNDINTGYSYAATRTATLSNAYTSSTLQPVTVHNRTYQVSIPVGVAFKLAANKKLEWFAGASIQPTYVFGGNAYLISADLKDYIAEPSLIRNWNVNTGIETYVNYKLGTLTLQVGPQLRYQLLSTYRKTATLIEKPYAMGLKVGIVKGF